MFSKLTLGQQFALTFILMAVLLGTFITRTTQRTNDFTTSVADVKRSNETLNGLEHILAQVNGSETAHRGYFFTGNASYLAPHAQAEVQLEKAFAKLRVHISDNPEQLKSLEALRELAGRVMAHLRYSAELRRTQGAESALSTLDTTEATQQRESLRQMVAEMRRVEETLLAAREETLAKDSRMFSWSFGVGAVMLMCISLILSSVVGNNLKHKLNTAISQVQGSSAELQTAASQQATGAREQASATTEISTTVKELLSTSRQIASSAQQVARVADETAGAAGTGNATVQQAQDAIDTVRRQVDAIVNHMLDLGKRSQEIGGILDIINELAEQTNILAINATIESAGAGEHGKRFAVVAEEIRKLADRVGGATKDIRVLIDEIRAASNTTIMATEDGSKAVQSSAQQFNDVAGNFRRIAELVRANLDVAREIELSTQQQTTAVEQVNTAILEVAQTARQAEGSSTQTLQTATRLIELSKQLSAIMDPRASV
ncbi:chemotaxis protein [Archangium minus]|uniref:Chemotaxis protein n=1 Tax=Archangium minus TaxID=83450 RepID=A0ABY9WI80_9BACT|nr:chemotaxis protein [Archangium minus]